MTKHTIKLLNQINRNFYQTVALEFDQTRQQPWEGWDQLLPVIKHLGRQSSEHAASLRVLDLGCGNGRFGKYLADELESGGASQSIKLKYTGVDSSDQLLAAAQVKFPEGKYVVHDIIEQLIEPDSPELGELPNNQDCVVAFGFLHHIPSSELRLKFLERCRQATRAGGRAILTAWHPTHSPSLMARRSLPKTLGIDPTQLEPGDYLLDWQRGASATRYCHDATLDELTKLIAQSPWQLEQHFNADGRSSNMNTYLVLK